MPYFNIVAETNQNTVVTEYEPVRARADSYQSEAALEQEFIRLLGEQGYQYLPIHNEADLIRNLRERLEELNKYSFTDSEWDRFLKESLANPNDHIVEKTRKIQEDNVQVLKRYAHFGYALQDNGFFKVKPLSDDARAALKKKFLELGFSALNFTDSRACYQFYNLARLWGDIQKAVDSGITLWHPATEPVSAGELHKFITGKPFVNELNGVPANYDYRTVHAALFGGCAGYIENKMSVMEQIRNFVEGTGR